MTNPRIASLLKQIEDISYISLLRINELREGLGHEPDEGGGAPTLTRLNR